MTAKTKRIAFNSIWAAGVAVPQTCFALGASAWWGCVIPAAMATWFFFMPCHDKTFGRGAPLHWVRQTFFASTVLGIVAIALTK